MTRWDIATHMQWPFFFKWWMFTVAQNLMNGVVIGHSVYMMRKTRRMAKERLKFPLLLYITEGQICWLPIDEASINHGLTMQEIPRNWYIPRAMWHDYER